MHSYWKYADVQTWLEKLSFDNNGNANANSVDSISTPDFACRHTKYKTVVLAVSVGGSWKVRPVGDFQQSGSLSLVSSLPCFDIVGWVIGRRHPAQDIRPIFPNVLIQIRLLLLLNPFNGLFLRTAWVGWYEKGKTSLDLYEARDDGILGWQWHQLDHM